MLPPWALSDLQPGECEYWRQRRWEIFFFLCVQNAHPLLFMITHGLFFSLQVRLVRGRSLVA